MSGQTLWPVSLVDPAVARSQRALRLVHRRGGIGRLPGSDALFVCSNAGLAEAASNPHVVRDLELTDRPPLLKFALPALDGHQHAEVRAITAAAIRDVARPTPTQMSELLAAAVANEAAVDTVSIGRKLGRIIATQVAGCPHPSQLESSLALDVSASLYEGVGEGLALAEESSWNHALETLRNSETELSGAAAGFRDALVLGHLAEEVAAAGLVFAYNSGLDTMTSVVSMALASIWTSDVLWERAAESPDDFVSEMMRIIAPVQFMYARASRSTSIGEVQVETGTPLVLGIASSCRDPALVYEPDEVRLDRPTHGSVFGIGAHRCLGAALATEVMRSVIRGALDGQRHSGQLRAARWPGDVFIHRPIELRVQP